MSKESSNSTDSFSMVLAIVWFANTTKQLKFFATVRFFFVEKVESILLILLKSSIFHCSPRLVRYFKQYGFPLPQHQYCSTLPNNSIGTAIYFSIFFGQVRSYQGRQTYYIFKILKQVVISFSKSPIKCIMKGFITNNKNCDLYLQFLLNLLDI